MEASARKSWGLFVVGKVIASAKRQKKFSKLAFVMDF